MKNSANPEISEMASLVSCPNKDLVCGVCIRTNARMSQSRGLLSCVAVRRPEVNVRNPCYLQA